MGPGPRARPPLDHADSSPARGDHPGDDLSPDPGGDQLGGAQGRHHPPGLPHQLIRHLRPRVRLHPGRPLRRDRDRAEPRRGQPGRLLQPPPAHPDQPRGAHRRPARRDARIGSLPGEHLHRGRADRGRPHRGWAPRRAGPGRPLGRDLSRLRLDRARGRDAGRRAGEGSEPLPAALRLPLPQLDEPAAEPDPDGLVPGGGDLQPGQLHGRGPAQPPDHRLDAEALALGFGCALGILALGLTFASLGLKERMVRT
jgi:hypothetical protein